MDDALNGGRGAFRSPELRGEDPDAYREKWLEDLVLFEHGAESNDAFARWVVHPVLKAAHHCLFKWGKVSLVFFFISITVDPLLLAFFFCFFPLSVSFLPTGN